MSIECAAKKGGVPGASGHDFDCGIVPAAFRYFVVLAAKIWRPARLTAYTLDRDDPYTGFAQLFGNLLRIAWNGVPPTGLFEEEHASRMDQKVEACERAIFPGGKRSENVAAQQ